MSESTVLERAAKAEEAAAKAVERYGHLLGRPGYVAQAEGGEVKVVPWTQSALRGHGSFTPRMERTAVPEPLIAQAKESLPRLRRRTATERLEAMTKTLIEDATQSYKRTGIPVMAASVIEDICRVFAFEYGRFISAESVRRMTLEQIRPLLESLAKRQFIEAGHKQQAKDQRKTALDWHGHLNHVVSAPSVEEDKTKHVSGPATAGLS